MDCERPSWIPDPRYQATDKFGSALRKIKVACGKCSACQSNHRKMWFFRLKVESNKCVSSYVVTLTYNDNDISDYITDPESGILYRPIRYSDIQGFNKRLRKALGPFRFFCVCEYGKEHLRPHYHICYFFDHPQDWTEFENLVFKNWFPDTRITVDQTNDKACNYILKYCLSPVGEEVPKCVRPILRCSTKPFIGHGLLDNQEFLDWLHLNKTDLSSYCGYKQKLPRILRDSIFSDDEKKFIYDELQSYIRKASDKKLEGIDKKCKKYGTMKGVEYIDFERQAFNSRINAIVKLKSIK